MSEKVLSGKGYFTVFPGACLNNHAEFLFATEYLNKESILQQASEGWISTYSFAWFSWHWEYHVKMCTSIVSRLVLLLIRPRDIFDYRRWATCFATPSQYNLQFCYTVKCDWQVIRVLHLKDKLWGEIK